MLSARVEPTTARSMEFINDVVGTTCQSKFGQDDERRYFTEVLVGELQLLPKSSIATGTGFAYAAEDVDGAGEEEGEEASS